MKYLISKLLTWKTSIAVAFFTAFTFWGLASADAAGNFSLEHKIKAVLIDKIVQFTVWKTATPGKSGQISYCVMEQEEAIGPILKTIREKKGADAGFRVLNIQSDTDLNTCSILYLDRASLSSSEWEQILNKVNDAHILTLSDHPDFLENGGMVQFFRDSGKIRFKISLKAAEQAQINFRSQLLRITPLYEN